MSKNFETRLVVILTDEFAKAVNKDGLQYAKDKALDPLKEKLAEEKATLTNQMRMVQRKARLLIGAVMQQQVTAPNNIIAVNLL